MASLCFILLAVAIVLIKQTPPATGYELSIFTSLPYLTWVFLILAFVGGIGIIVHQAFAGARNNFWLVGFFIIILSNFVILSLPVFRDYLFYGSGDTLGHFSTTSSIVSQGYLAKSNWYPITHILGAQIIQVTSIPLEIVIKYIPVIFTILFMVFTYLLASVTCFKRGHVLLASAASATLLLSYYHLAVYPSALAVFTLPLLFYVYFKATETSSISYWVMFIITLCLFPLFHPYIALVVISCLIGGEIARVIWNSRNKLSPVAKPAKQFPIRLILIISLAVFLVVWFTRFGLFTWIFRPILGWLSGQISELPRMEELGIVFPLGVVEQVKLFLKMYGANLIYGILSLAALFVIFRLFWRRWNEAKNLFTLAFFFIFTAPAWVAAFLGTFQMSWGRFLAANPVMWATPVLVGLALYELFHRPKVAKTVAVVAVTFLLVVSSVLGIFSAYRSPWILQPNWQITRMDVCGSQWFIDNYDRPLYASKVGLPLEYLAASRGAESIAGMGWFTGYRQVTIPAHFGYPYDEKGHEPLVVKEVPILLTARFKLANAHPVLSEKTVSTPAMGRTGFNEADFKRLEQDPSVSRLYSNGEFEVLFGRYLDKPQK